jgi:catechol 2,3-dioxygenase-like lactoylglutathione lyase family enzyme
MLGRSTIVAFVSTRRPARALRFYRDTLGLRLRADTPFAFEFDANGIMLRVSKVKDLTVAPYTVLGWDVADILKTVRRLSRKRVRMARFKGLDQDNLGIWSSPSGARVAWFRDPDGNTLSLTQFPRRR